ncbi:unnamed protein product [Cladocopium goreaui]|uniref:Acyltransferase 3 domain-containing protein n=1 Tax=Cladocopium goreaui TaxID=2562237 RepID=A0A9P1FYT4_9DINO|nr:unnamed protein product [Cladocopium goreaui]
MFPLVKSPYLHPFPSWTLRKQLFHYESSKGHLSALDGLRALALLWVFSLHSLLVETWDVETQKRREIPVFEDLKLQWWAQLPLHGNTGMDAFFVLSGLLMSRAYQKIQSSSIKERYGVFLLRRLCRIWPMVCAAVLASMVISCIHPARTLPSQWVWTHLLLLQNLFVDSLKNPDLPFVERCC